MIFHPRDYVWLRNLALAEWELGTRVVQHLYPNSWRLSTPRMFREFWQ